MARRKGKQHSLSETEGLRGLPARNALSNKTIGRRVRELRLQRGLSLRGLMAKSGLSANTLSMVENGKVSPSIRTLHCIAMALNVPINSFLEAEVRHEAAVYTQHDQRQRIEFAHGQMEELGSGIGIEGLESFILHFKPLSDSGPELLVGEGEELIFCLAGQVVYTIEGKTYTLEPGDSLFFPAKLAHSWRNSLEECSQVMVVMIGRAGSEG